MTNQIITMTSHERQLDSLFSQITQASNKENIKSTHYWSDNRWIPLRKASNAEAFSCCDVIMVAVDTECITILPLQPFGPFYGTSCWHQASGMDSKISAWILEIASLFPESTQYIFNFLEENNVFIKIQHPVPNQCLWRCDLHKDCIAWVLVRINGPLTS